MTEFILYHPTFPKNIGSWEQLITNYTFQNKNNYYPETFNGSNHYSLELLIGKVPIQLLLHSFWAINTNN